MSRKDKKNKKKHDEFEVIDGAVEIPVEVEEPKPEPIPEPEPEPVKEPEPLLPIIPDGVKVLWKSQLLDNEEQIVDLFNTLEHDGFEIADFDFEYRREGDIKVVYKIKKAE